MIEFTKQEELDKIRSALKKDEKYIKDGLMRGRPEGAIYSCLGTRPSDLETIKTLLDYIDDLHAMLNDPLLPLYLPHEFPKIDHGTCDGCEHAEWRDEEYDWNIAEGYWWCTKYHDSLNSTWNDYGCNKCKECEENEETQ